MFSPNSGPDPAGRAALRMLMQRLPELSLIDGGYLEPFNSSEPPTLRSAPVVEGSGMRGIRVSDYSRQSTSNFGAFLDGAQRVQVVGHRRGIPIVYATVSAAIRVRINRRFVTWGHRPPVVARRFFLPFRYLPELAQDAAISAEQSLAMTDTSKADINGQFPSAHPSVLQERAMRAVDELREQLEYTLAEAWCARAESPLFIDGGTSGNPRVASSTCAIGVVKSHRTLHVDDDSLHVVLGLTLGERSSVFRVAPRSRSAVMSWYLRVRDATGHDPLWGLVRVEVTESSAPTERANEISRWVMKEMSPLSLPDGRWDKMSYGIRDCEEFLRAIS
ncbi:MAG TPA: hypothetical protein VJV97_00285 [Gemmatimonadaceae bacterium]|nr:hypothetical protein [Gemmatimonadaceae bacterium]